MGHHTGSTRPKQRQQHLGRPCQDRLVDPPGALPVGDGKTTTESGTGRFHRRVGLGGQAHHASGEGLYGDRHRSGVGTTFQPDFQFAGWLVGHCRAAKVHLKKAPQALPGPAHLQHPQESSGPLHVHRAPLQVADL